jgi:hypothetical protein
MSDQTLDETKLTEEWRPIPFATRYQASSYGRIKSVYGWIMKPTLTARGYFVCTLEKRQYRVNRIICWTFHGEPASEEYQAAHRDSNSQNNHKDNLYWATIEQNAQDLKDTGHKKGESSGINRITEADAIKIRELVKSGYRISTVHKLWYPHVTRGVLQHIISKRTWTHVNG